jgi:hypothetical protein
MYHGIKLVIKRDDTSRSEKFSKTHVVSCSVKTKITAQPTAQVRVRFKHQVGSEEYPGIAFRVAMNRRNPKVTRREENEKKGGEHRGKFAIWGDRFENGTVLPSSDRENVRRVGTI